MDCRQLIPLEWDSDFFGYKVARLDLGNSTELPPLPASDFKLIYIFNRQEIKGMESKLVDKKAYFQTTLLDLEEVPNQSILIEAFDRRKHSSEELVALTLESGIFSRFFVDPNFKDGEYEKLYRRWIENSVDKKSALEVFVAVERGHILGFITVGEKGTALADIGLLAVSPQARGKKIAKTLVQHVKSYALKKGFKRMQVVTQLDNQPATRLYEATGFELNELTYIYHIWNNDTI